MNRTNKPERAVIIYSAFFIAAHSELRNSLLKPWLNTLDVPFWLYKQLFTLSFLGLYGVPFFMIMDGKNVIQWRKIMKTNFWGWFALIACSVAFIVLMTEVCRYMDNLGEAIRVTIAALTIFIPNMWALTHLIGETNTKGSAKKE